MSLVSWHVQSERRIARACVGELLALRGTREPVADHELMRDSIQSLAHLDTPEELDGHLPPRM